MSIVIEQTHTELQSSNAFSRKSEIISVKISSASFSASRAVGLESLEIEESLSVGVRYTELEAIHLESYVRATTQFECLITKSFEADDIDPIATFECSLIATYLLHDDYTPSSAELSAFHKANVIFNSWPYFREFIQNAACRMNIPPPPIPFVRVQVRSEEPVKPKAHLPSKTARTSKERKKAKKK